MNRIARRTTFALAAAILIGCQSENAAWHQRVLPAPPRIPTAQEKEAGRLFAADFADQDFSRPLTRETAFQILLNTETFAHAHVGYNLVVPNQVEAFQVLSRQPDAVDTFSDLLQRGHTAGQLYALCGIRLLAPAHYAEIEPIYLKSDATVPCAEGCIIRNVRVQHLVKHAAESWDISGGAVPATLRDAR